MRALLYSIAEMSFSTRLVPAATLLLMVCPTAPRLAGGQATQLPPTAPAVAASAQPASTGSASTPSAVLQPALSSLREAIGGVRLDKWKASGTARQKADANLDSIQRDLENTLPGLVTRADAAPGSMSQVLPLSRNVDALYDVVLRVANTAELAAPGAQSAALNDALGKLESARRSLGERLQTLAAAEDKQVKDLQSALSASAQPAVAPACPAPATSKTGTAASHAAAKKKAAAKKVPAANATATPAPKQ